MNRFHRIVVAAGCATIFGGPHFANAADEWIEVPVLVNVQKGVVIDDDAIEEAVKEANEVLKQAMIKLKFNKKTDIKKDFNDQGNNNDKIDSGEDGKLDPHALKELEKHLGKGTKGYKIVITNDIHGDANTSGLSPHDPKSPISYIKKTGTNKEIGQTVAHEFAHVFTLGVKHVIDSAAGKRADGTGHSDDKTNLMWPAPTKSGLKLTADQIAEIRKQNENKGGKVKAVDADTETQRSQTFRSWRRTAPDFNVVPDVGGLFNTGVVQGDLLEHPTGTLSLDVSYGSTGTGDQVQVRVGMNTDNNTATGNNLGGSLNGIDKWVNVQIVGDPETTGIVSAQLFDWVLGPQGSIPLEFERIVKIRDDETGAPSTTAVYDQINFNLEPISQLGIAPIGAPPVIPIEFLSMDSVGMLSDSFVYSIGWGDTQSEPDVFLETFTARAGDSVDLTGFGFLPSKPGIIQLDDLEVGAFTTGGLGDIASMFNVPLGTRNGFYYVTASLDEVPFAIGGLSTFGFAMLQVVPEPAAGVLLLIGGFAMFLGRRGHSRGR